MLPRTSLRIVRPVPDTDSGERSSKPLSLEQRKEIFKGLVVSSLDAGFLRYSRRQELLRLAARMGIGEFEASLLIAEAQFRSGEIHPIESDVYMVEKNPVSAGVAASTKITLALVVAAFADAILVWWLL